MLICFEVVVYVFNCERKLKLEIFMLVLHHIMIGLKFYNII